MLKKLTPYFKVSAEDVKNQICLLKFLNQIKTLMDVIIGILHDKSKVVYTLLILYFGSEIGN
jgi:hypothetical protein